MCTLIVLNEHLKSHPLVVAANRDERYDRTASAPAEHRSLAGRTMLRPWDHEKCGTWIGVSEEGWFVGITNQDDGKHEETERSRGQVVDAILGMKTHYDAAAYLRDLSHSRVHLNPFNLIFGRPGSLFLCRYREDCNLELDPLWGGINVISNDCDGHHYQRKVNHAYALACRIDPDGSELVASAELFKLLGDHTGATPLDPYQAMCVHAPAVGFGTRSTSIITVSKEGDAEYWYSEGPPCQSDGLMLAGHIPQSACVDADA